MEVDPSPTDSLDVELKELCRISFAPQNDVVNQNYLKNLSFSPDGQFIATAVNGQGLKVIQLPRDLCSVPEPSSKYS